MEEFRTKSMFDSMKETEDELRRWNRTHRIGCVRYCKRDNCIIIDVPHGEEYWISMNRLKTAAQCLDWIHQVFVKTWGPKVMPDFLKVLFRMIPSDLW